MPDHDIFVTRPHIPPFEEYAAEIRPLWESKWITNLGALHQQLECALAQKLKVGGLSLFTNGHLALEGALQALELSGEVITTPFTFASTTHAIVRQGLTPVFCDIKETDGTIDETKIEALITEKTSAILPVHVYGNCCNVEEIARIAQKHGLRVIYDAAHAFGVELAGQGIGSYGDLSMFSFHATKVFHTIEGGAVCYKDPALGRVFHHIRDFGIEGEEMIAAVGGNAKMNEFQAAMGLCNLRHFEEEVAQRKVLTEEYRRQLEGIPGLRMLRQRAGATHNYAYMPVLIEPNRFEMDRDALCAVLREHRIFTRKYFFPLVTDFACYREQYAGVRLPVAKRMAQQVLTLPLYSELRSAEVEEICAVIRECAG